MKPIISTFAILIIAASVGSAQSIQQLPFASRNNKIELTVANTGVTTVPSVSVEIKNIPSWLEFTSPGVTLTGLGAQSELPALFSFNVDKSAPVNEEHRLLFTITTQSGEPRHKEGGGQVWTKEIPVSVAPPERFELFQNYPNPFNPSTTIAYQLPEPSHVTLSIYNLLGQMVERPVETDQVAGYHEVVWNAGRHASGFYLYELQTSTKEAKTQIERKRMVLLK